MAFSFLPSANLAGLCGEKPVCAPGRTCGAFASCGTSEARRRGPMSELSDAGGFGSRQARRGAAHGEERRPTSASEKASDNARRRESAMNGAGEAACGAGESEEGRDGAPNALENAKRGHVRGLAERNLRGLGESRRTATRRHTSVCRAVARTRESPRPEGEYRCPDRVRILTRQRRQGGRQASRRLARRGAAPVS